MAVTTECISNGLTDYWTGCKADVVTKKAATCAVISFGVRCREQAIHKENTLTLRITFSSTRHKQQRGLLSTCGVSTDVRLDCGLGSFPAERCTVTR